MSNTAFCINHVTVDPDAGTLATAAGEAHLPPRLVKLLCRLASAKGATVSREDLIDELWPRGFVNEEALSRAVADLRQYLGDDARQPAFIETVPKRGYRLVADIHWPESGLDTNLPTSAEVSASSLLRWGKKTTLLFALLAVLAGGLLTFWPRQHSSSDSYPALLASARALSTEPGIKLQPELSSDGKWLAYVTAFSGLNGLHLLATGNATDDREIESELPLTSPVFDPAGSRLAVAELDSATCKLVLISLNTEERQVLGSCNTPSQSAILDWSADGSMLAYVDIGKHSSSPGIWLMRLSDGQHTQLSDPADAYQFDTRPRFSPDGARLSFSRGTRAARDIWVLELGTDPFGAQSMPEPQRLSFDNQYTTSHDWFEDGRSLILDSERSGFRALWQLDMDGNWTLLGARDGQSPSRGGKQLAFVIANYDANIWMLDPATGVSSPQALISSSKYDSNPNWSPDGQEIAFTSNRTGAGSLWISNADGSRQRQVYEPETGRVVWPQWSPDGNYLLATRYDETGQSVIRVALNQREVTVIPTAGEHPYGNQVSADGLWLYYVASIGNGGTRLWRQPLGGLRAAEIVIDNRVDSFQLIDDRWILYTRLDEAGLFRIDMAQASAGVLVLDSPAARLQSGWTANRQWIYFNALAADNRPVLMRQPFDGGTPVEISSAAATALMPNMSIHPVSGLLLQARTDRAQADLFITEAGR